MYPNNLLKLYAAARANGLILTVLSGRVLLNRLTMAGTEVAYER